MQNADLEQGRRLVERLGGRWTEAGGTCRCPAHDDRTPSLSVRPGRTRLLFHCFAGCRAEDVLEALVARRLLDPGRARTNEAPTRRPPKRSEAAARIWSGARSLGGTPAEAYLASRGIVSNAPSLRFHPRTPDGAGPCASFRPAMIAAVRDEAGLTGIHRTFLDISASKSAPAASAKRGLGRFGSGAVRLGEAKRVLGLAEGIETALSASLLFSVPCWASLGAERFGRIALPPEVQLLKLFLDLDAAGRRSERLAREAFARTVQIEAFYPERAGEDWNDELLRRSVEGEGRKRRDG